MRQDQVMKLQELSEQLVDVFLMEADPKLLPGYPEPPNQWSKDERGNRYWSKRNAAATLSLVARISTLIDRGIGVVTPAPAPGDTAEDDERDELQREVEGAESEAMKRIEEVRLRLGGKAH